MQIPEQQQVLGRPRRLWLVIVLTVLVLGVVAVFALPVTFVGLGGAAVASNPGNNGRLVYSDLVESKTHPGEWSSEVFTMNPDGSDVRRLTFDAGGEPWVKIGDEEWSLSMNHSAAWSPRGDAIVYVHLSAVEAIRLIDPEGAPLGTVTEAFVNVGSVSWSPDGQQLAFYGVAPGDSGGRAGLWVIRIDGTEPRLLIDEDAASVIFISSPEWSPDGDSIAYAPAGADEPPWLPLNGIEPNSCRHRPEPFATFAGQHHIHHLDRQGRSALVRVTASAHCRQRGSTRINLRLAAQVGHRHERQDAHRTRSAEKRRESMSIDECRNCCGIWVCEEQSMSRNTPESPRHGRGHWFDPSSAHQQGGVGLDGPRLTGVG
jgi:hypothetical protein